MFALLVGIHVDTVSSSQCCDATCLTIFPDDCPDQAEPFGPAASSLLATEFCTDYLRDVVELYMTDQVLTIWADLSDYVSILTETERYVCNCDRDASTNNVAGGTASLWVQCSLIYQFEDADGTTYTHVNADFMQFEATGSAEQFIPVSAGWFDYEVSDFLGTFFAHEIFLNKDSNSTLFDACNLVDYTCPDGNRDIDCQVCPDGSDIFYNYTCGGFIGESVCGEEELDGISPSFLYELHLIQPMTPYVEYVSSSGITCYESQVAETIFTVEEFCEDLTEVEFLFNIEMEKILVDGSSIEGFQCNCSEIFDDMTMVVQCITDYEVPSENGTMTTLTSVDGAVFEATHGEGATYLIPARVGWCVDPYCEFYEVALGQDGLTSCEIDGCLAGHCSLCSDDLSVVHDCQGSFINFYSCSQQNAGSFWLLFRDTRLAVEKCTDG